MTTAIFSRQASELVVYGYLHDYSPRLSTRPSPVHHPHQFALTLPANCETPVVSKLESWHFGNSFPYMVIGLRATSRQRKKTHSGNCRSRDHRVSENSSTHRRLCSRGSSTLDDDDDLKSLRRRRHRLQWHPALPSLLPRPMASPPGLPIPCRLSLLRPSVSISSSMFYAHNEGEEEEEDEGQRKLTIV